MDQGIHQGGKRVAQQHKNEKRKEQLCVFTIHKTCLKFEGFCLNLFSSINLFFLRSNILILILGINKVSYIYTYFVSIYKRYLVGICSSHINSGVFYTYLHSLQYTHQQFTLPTEMTYVYEMMNATSCVSISYPNSGPSLRILKVDWYFTSNFE